MPAVTRLDLLPVGCAHHHERLLRFHNSCHDIGLAFEASGCAEPDGFTCSTEPPLGNNVLHLRHFTANQIPQQGVSVETTAILANLHSPRPYFFRWSVDRNGMCHLAGGGDEVVARQSRANLGVSSALPLMPGSKNESINSNEHRQNRSSEDESVSHGGVLPVFLRSLG